MGKPQAWKPRGGAPSGGAWVYVPSGVNVQSVVSSGFARHAGGPPKAKSKYEEKLKKIDNSLKVWVGGLADGTTWKQVENHFKEVAKPAVTDMIGKKNAVVAYKTAEDAETAISALNGSELNGSTIEVDVWTQKPKTDKPKATGKPKGQLIKKSHLKTSQPLTKADAKTKEKLKAIPASQKIWIGGLAQGTTWQELEKHFAAVAKPKISHIYRGTGCVVYDESEDLAAVISALNASELKGATLEVDVWEKPEKGEK